MGLHDVNTEMMSSKLEETLAIIRKVNEQFKNPVGIRPNQTKTEASRAESEKHLFKCSGSARPGSVQVKRQASGADEAEKQIESNARDRPSGGEEEAKRLECF